MSLLEEKILHISVQIDIYERCYVSHQHRNSQKYNFLNEENVCITLNSSYNVCSNTGNVKV